MGLNLLGLPRKFDPRRVSPGNLAAWYDFHQPRNGGVALADADGITICEDLANPGRAFYDPFTRADSTSSVGNGWTTLAGTAGISSNQGYFSATVAGNKCSVVRETGLADGVAGITFATVDTVNGTRLCLRMTDVDNGFIVNAESTTYKLYRLEGGSYTQIGTVTLTPANGDVIRAILNGSTIIVQVNGTTRITVTDTFNQTATKHGFGTGTSTTTRWDDFVVAKLTDAVQSTAAAKLAYKVNIQNSRAVGRGNGTSTYMQTAPFATALSQPTTVFIVADVNATNDFLFDGISVNNRHYALSNSSGNWQAGTSLGAISGFPYNNSFNVHAMEYNATSSGWYQNGSKLLSGSITSSQALTGLTIGASYVPSLYLDGDIAEILIFKASLTKAQRRKVRAYLARRWGISLVNILSEDSYTRSDSATTLGNAETGQAYTAAAGTWGIASNTAYVSTSSGGADIAVVESGYASCTVQATISTNADGAGVVFRYTDTSNYNYVKNDGGTEYELFKVVSDTPTSLGTYTTTPAAGDVLRVVTSGNSITVYLNGTSRITATDAANNTATKHGLTATSTTPRFDNLSIEV